MKAIPSPSLAAFLRRDRAGRFWDYVALLISAGSVILCWRMAVAFELRPRFIVMDPSGTLIVTREKDFQDARQLHFAQAELAVQTLLSRQPNGFDSEARLKRLFDRATYAQAVELQKSEAAEFAAKSLHQKPEVERTRIQKLTGTTVEVAVQGQLIRTGSFEGRPSVEVLRFDLRMRFEHNPSLLDNARFPTVVRSFDLTTTPFP